MTSNNKYEDMSVLTVLRCAKERSLLLPDIQREYVWDVSEIEALFESIADDYPIGSCIFWKTNRSTINKEKPNLYYFIETFEKGKTKNQKAPDVLAEERDYYIVLDGQQRITSLNIALNGSYTYYKGGRGKAWDNPKYWVKKELYYNLDYRTAKEVDDEHPRKRFVFLTVEEASQGHYYKVKQMLAYDNSYSFSNHLRDCGVPEECGLDLAKLFERLHDSSGKGLIHYYCINEKTYDDALDIFVRVNSTGRKLSKSDLLFSTLIDEWKEGKEKIETLLGIMNSKGDRFEFSRDYLMRLCLVLVDADPKLKIVSLNRLTINSIINQWDRISKSLDVMSTLLQEIGLNRDTLPSYNATMPIAYYIFKGGEIKNTDTKKEIKKFLSVSFFKSLFGVASNSALVKTREALKKIDCQRTPFRLDLFASVTLTGGRSFVVNEEEIDRWLNSFEKGQSTYIVLSLLYPNYKLSQVAFHQDHCHPYIAFETKNLSSLGLSKEKISDWQKKRNLLPNLQFLEGGENESKNKIPLIDWVAQNNEFCYHPNGISLELKDFEDFFEQRRKMIKDELERVFGL